MTLEQLRGLIKRIANAHFACGDWRDGDEWEYETFTTEAKEAESALIKALEEVGLTFEQEPIEQLEPRTAPESSASYLD